MKKRKVLIGVVVLLALAFSVRVYQLNTKYPQVKVVEVPRGEKSEAAKNVDFKVNSVKEYNQDSIKKHVKKETLKFMDITERCSFFKVNVDIENKNDKPVKFDVWMVNIECVGYNNAHDQVLMDEWNDNWGTDMWIPAHGKLNLNLGYSVLFINTTDTIEKMKSDGLYLVYDCYPKKTEWMLF